MGTAISRGREAFAGQAWGEAYVQLSTADGGAELDVEDLERLAVAAFLVGRHAPSEDAWERAHRGWLTRGEADRAARCAFWLAFGLLDKGEFARGGGWLARARRVLDDYGLDSVERGYILVPFALGTMVAGDAETAFGSFEEACAIGERFGDADLIALGRMGGGRALIRLGRAVEGVGLLDEAMVAVTTREVSPLVAGRVYCALIDTCLEEFDLRRAQEWTSTLSRWCEPQADLVPFAGVCRLHRAEIMQLHGAWSDAVDEVQRACERLTGHLARGLAFYVQGELHRVRGEFELAEEAYRQARRWGRDPIPGAALLGLAKGNLEAAVAAIGRVVDEAGQVWGRATGPPHVRRRLRHVTATLPEVLVAYVEIMLAAGDVAAARSAADQLCDIAAGSDSRLLRAMADQALGATLLSEGDVRGALTALRGAWTVWQELDVPYEAARVRVLVGLGCRALDDEDTAVLEFDIARAEFARLGAACDVGRVDSLMRRRTSQADHGLSRRELEVLRLLTGGDTNKAIAGKLVVSERTVDRHVSNILTKLGVSSRTAAASYAHERHLV